MNSEQQKLDPVDLQSYLDGLRDSILADYCSTEKIDRTRVEHLIDQIYIDAGKPRPKYRWFSNPRDLLKAAEESGQKTWLSIAKMEDKSGSISRKALEKTISREDFDTFFRALWDSLPEREIRSLALQVRSEITPDLRLTFQEEQSQIDQRKNLMDVLKAMMDRPTMPPPFFNELEWSSASLIRLAIARAACEFFEADIETEERKRLDNLQELARSSHAYMFSELCCDLSERPIVFHVDEQFRTHCGEGPAVVYDGDFNIYCWRNTRATEYAIKIEPTVDIIEKQDNVETRRVLIDRYGIEKYILDTGAEIVHHDKFGTLYRKNQLNDEPIVLVRITNSSPEPDGSFREYFLRVPPGMRTAREAVAWTFNLSPEEYAPEIET